MKKLSVELQILLHDWDEARVQTFGIMMAQMRPFRVSDYPEDLKLIFICGLLAELLEPLIIDAITMNMRMQMAEKAGEKIPSASTFESIGSGYVLIGKHRHCKPRMKT